MGILKTQQMLVDVARQLFAKSGKNNVTMNDIATASQKGRRTLYTYFKNKNDIYLAVIDKELKLLQEKLQVVINKPLAPDAMLIDYIFTRMLAVKEAVTRNGSLRADFFRDIYEVEHARRRADVWETQQLKGILDKGVDEGVFECDNTDIASIIMFYAMKGVEQPYLRKGVSHKIDHNREEIIRFLFNGFLSFKKKNNQ